MASLHSYQFDLDRELQAERSAGYHSCPQCGGVPEYDSDGRPFTCYYCCDTGCVPAEVAAQWARDEADAREYAPLRRVVNGKHILQCCDEYDAWDVLQSLLPLEHIQLEQEAPRVAAVDCDDDIPF